MKLFVTDQDGQEHELDAQAGQALMEVIRDAGLEIAAQCGGFCSCATCHIYVDEAWLQRLPEKSEDEEAMLELAIDPIDRSRLSCQVQAADDLDGLQVTLAPGSTV